MHILITVFFNAPLGGLHNNILSTINALIEDRHQVTVLSKPGVFQDKLLKMGVNIIPTNYNSTSIDVKKVLNQGKIDYDLVHAHPFSSRLVGCEVAQKLNIPLILTFHGMYLDALPTFIDKTSMIFVVSQGVMDYLKSSIRGQYEKFMIMPNGVDCGRFKPVPLKPQGNDICIGLFTRLDPDKKLIIQSFYQALKMTSINYAEKVKWVVVGDGKLAGDVKNNVDEIVRNTDLKVKFVGWLEGVELVKSYQTCDIILAPGRSALEGMACGKPVIASGCKSYIGVINEKNWLQGVYTNFGEYKVNDYQPGQIEDDLRKLIVDSNLRYHLGRFGARLADQFFNEELINKKIIDIYRIVAEEY